MTADCDISVVVITWNQLERLKACLASLAGNAKNCSAEIIVIDNGSSDDTGEWLKSQPGLKVILNGRNRGVAPARNQGIAAATGRFILMLDDDTVVHSGCLDRLVGFMSAHPAVWLAGGRQLRPDGSLEYSARTFYNPLMILARRSFWGRTAAGKRWIAKHLMLDWDHNDDRTVDWVAGACFCMRTEAIKKIGPLDESYFFGFEDVDWSYRVWRAGGKVAYVHDAAVTHFVQGSSRRLFSRKAACHLASMIRFYSRYGFARPYPSDVKNPASI
ncbi:MAG: glycosyltransferase family 2 protein [Planctomycetes bacterium]|nr:glycosyltransferase family 2 protein [Planctomycetota bacterium]